MTKRAATTKAGRAWNYLFPAPLRTHEEVGKQLGLSRRTVQDVEALAIFRVVSVLCELAGEALPCGISNRANQGKRWRDEQAV